MEIVLARHGRPKLDQRSWVTPRQFAEWIAAYNDADVFVDEAPSDLKAKANVSWIVSSPFIRCVQSAKALAPAREMSVEEVFSEAALPHPLWQFPWLPVSVWTLIFRAAWFCGYSGRSESLSLANSRARTAAARLIQLAGQHQSVLLVGHGIMTALIAKQLVQEGWSGGRRVHRYWQFGVYEK